MNWKKSYAEIIWFGVQRSKDIKIYKPDIKYMVARIQMCTIIFSGEKNRQKERN